MVKLGLIGLGQAAQILHLPNIEKMGDKFNVTAVADISAPKSFCDKILDTVPGE